MVKEKLTPQKAYGWVLAERLGQCGERHTPRNALGGMDLSHWFVGARNPSGPGLVPNITPAKLDWSDDDIVTYLTTGFTPSFDSAGSSMGEVVDNMADPPKADAEAIAAYLKRVPPRS